jgi:hypothetical protein
MSPSLRTPEQLYEQTTNRMEALRTLRTNPESFVEFLKIFFSEKKMMCGENILQRKVSAAVRRDFHRVNVFLNF